MLLVDGHSGEVPVRDTAHGLDLIGQRLDPISRALQTYRQVIAVFVNGKMECTKDKVRVDGEARPQALSGLSRAMIANHREHCGHRFVAPLQATGDQKIADHISNGFRSVFVAAGGDMPVEGCEKLGIKRDTETVYLGHGCVSVPMVSHLDSNSQEKTLFLLVLL